MVKAAVQAVKKLNTLALKRYIIITIELIFFFLITTFLLSFFYGYLWIISSFMLTLASSSSNMLGKGLFLAQRMTISTVIECNLLSVVITALKPFQMRLGGIFGNKSLSHHAPHTKLKFITCIISFKRFGLKKSLFNTFYCLNSFI